MAIDKYKNCLIIFLEDKPYREIINGIKLSPNVDESVIHDKNPSGGWKKTFNELESNLKLLNSRETMFALLLIDFDHQFQQRKDKFDILLLEQPCKDRVFILGIDAKQSEDLKHTLHITNNEKIGRMLVENCPDKMAEAWENKHLLCNNTEISRMRNIGVFDWLFLSEKLIN
ncbi:MAG: hypothetical protein LKF82_08645 [Acinetobacter populi]|jgi:hypothetical protein|uniref:hypothetical protein n=1 Tax=Acinetobacter populi TaxID=1582270 RepID=UPI0023527A7E|nr:hypothetical protein [Acinetobacter populi]MCH4247892.1 hypothetical protein [Acinetobacter populi]